VPTVGVADNNTGLRPVAGTEACPTLHNSFRRTIVNSRRTSGLGAGKGTTVFTICEVTRKRTKPILIEVKWRHDSKSGISKFVVSPEQNNIVRR
jgi:hypothetical protein